MRTRYDHTSGTGLSFTGVSDKLSVAANTAYDNLPGATVYMLLNWDGVPGRFAWKSFTGSVSSGTRIIQIDGSSRLQAQLRRSAFNSMIDAERFPRGKWMMLAVAWAADRQRLYKAEYPKPLVEVAYNTNSISTGSVDSEANRPWIIGNSEPGGQPTGGIIQHFRYYNQFFDRHEVVRHQFEFGPARGQVVNVDLGVYVGSSILEKTRGDACTITGAVERKGIIAMEPDLMPEFIGTDQLVGDGIIPAVFHQRFHNLAL